MKKFFVGVVLSVLLIANSAFAETFSQPVKIGEVGFPVQAPYHGFVVEGATQNDGKPFTEEFEYNGAPRKTYVKGTAHFGDLLCKYDFDAEFPESIHFGGAGDFVLTTDGSFKEIFSIDGNGLKLCAIYHNYCVSDLKILGSRGGKWVVFVDSKKLSEKYFGGKDSYKTDGGVLYDVPTCAGDTIVVVYRRWHWGGESAAEGEFRFKWDDAAQWFSVEQVIY